MVKESLRLSKIHPIINVIRLLEMSLRLIHFDNAVKHFFEDYQLRPMSTKQTC